MAVLHRFYCIITLGLSASQPDQTLRLLVSLESCACMFDERLYTFWIYSNIYYMNSVIVILVIFHIKKQVNMIRKCHNHTSQTNPRHREEEPHSTDCHKTPGRQLKQKQSNHLSLSLSLSLSLIPIKMIAKLERTQYTK